MFLFQFSCLLFINNVYWPHIKYADKVIIVIFTYYENLTVCYHWISASSVLSGIYGTTTHRLLKVKFFNAAFVR